MVGADCTAQRNKHGGCQTPVGMLGHSHVKTENTRNAALVGLHPPFRRTASLKWRTGSAILKPLSVSIVLT
jgi:hypothetical protein